MYNSKIQTQNQINPRITRLLWKQQQELQKKNPDCVIPIINNEDPLDIQADIIGPKSTPYENGIFRVKLFIPNDFPIAPPKGFFITKIYHPNVSEKGEICVNTLKKDWNPKLFSLFNLFEVIKCLLIVPFPESSLNEEAGKIFMENYKEYFNIAQMYTKIYAMKKNNNFNSNNSFSNNKNNYSFNNDNLIEESCSNCFCDSINNNNNIKSNFGDNEMKSNIEQEKENINSGDFSILINRNYSLSDKNVNSFLRTNSSNIGNNFNNISNSIFQNNNINFDLNNGEKPKLNYLPFIRASSFDHNNNNSNNNNLFQRSNTVNINEPVKRNNKEEINKWLLRI